MSLGDFFKKIVGRGEPTSTRWVLPLIVEPYRRTCWIPQVEDGDGSPLDSKFSGIPYLAPDERWPICRCCSEPMQLFLQLNPCDLPTEATKLWGEGLLQFYYCTGECDDGWKPFSKASLVRAIVPGIPHAIQTPLAGPFPAKRIVGWDASDDYPNWDELSVLGKEITQAETDAISEVGFPRSGEKLLGWPHWVQSVEYPSARNAGPS